jgi:hypothetical protein
MVYYLLRLRTIEEFSVIIHWVKMKKWLQIGNSVPYIQVETKV